MELSILVNGSKKQGNTPFLQILTSKKVIDFHQPFLSSLREERPTQESSQDSDCEKPQSKSRRIPNISLERR